MNKKQIDFYRCQQGFTGRRCELQDAVLPIDLEPIPGESMYKELSRSISPAPSPLYDRMTCVGLKGLPVSTVTSMCIRSSTAEHIEVTAGSCAWVPVLMAMVFYMFENHPLACEMGCMWIVVFQENVLYRKQKNTISTSYRYLILYLLTVETFCNNTEFF